MLVTILIIGAPKEWPAGTIITSGSHSMYTADTRPLWLSNGILYNQDHCSRYVRYPISSIVSLWHGTHWQRLCGHAL